MEIQKDFYAPLFRSFRDSDGFVVIARAAAVRLARLRVRIVPQSHPHPVDAVIRKKLHYVFHAVAVIVVEFAARVFNLDNGTYVNAANIIV